MICKDSRIYIAGHRGLIGTEIVKCLEEAGYQNLLFKTSQELDLTRQADVEAFFKKESPDYVILNAALLVNSDNVQQNPVHVMLGNTAIITNVLNTALRFGVKKLVYLCSAACYPCDAGTVETPLGPAWPESELQPGRIVNEQERYYALPKLLGKEICEKINLIPNGMRCVTLVPPHVYGNTYHYERGKLPVYPALIKRFCEAVSQNIPEISIWGTGQLRREFTHASDVAKACALLLENTQATGVFNVGGGEFVSIRELAELLQEISGYRGQLTYDTTKPEAIQFCLLQSDKLRALGWAPSVPFRDGVLQSYNYYRAHYGD